MVLVPPILLKWLGLSKLNVVYLYSCFFSSIENISISSLVFYYYYCYYVLVVLFFELPISFDILLMNGYPFFLHSLYSVTGSIKFDGINNFLIYLSLMNLATSSGPESSVGFLIFLGILYSQ